MVFYRKYRPQTIDELDLLHVREKLSSILLSKEIPHAFLFTGPKGLGKTSSARILAKAINCERLASSKLASSQEQKKLNAERLTLDASVEPCNKCAACVSITNGSNIDVLEIDAASNRGVDEIRELRERVKFAPAALSKKIYIIDEVHMLTNEAFNALLKTLEEPPDHVIFILCTTEMWKLPVTIVSRTFVVRFEKPSEDELVRSLDRILKGEKLSVDKEVLHEVYKRSEGSFRDAAKMMEELAISAPDKKIGTEVFENIFKSGTINHHVIQLLEDLSNKDVKNALISIDEMTKAGYDFRVVLESLIEYLRQFAFIRTGITTERTIDISDYTLADISRLLDGFQTAYQQVRYSPVPQLPLELVVIEYCSVPQFVENPTVQGKKKVEVLSSADQAVNKTSIKPKSQDVLPDFLNILISQVKKENQSLAGVLRSCKIEKHENDKLTLSTPYKFHAEKINDPKVLEVLSNIVSKIKAKPYTVVVEMKK